LKLLKQAIQAAVTTCPEIFMPVIRFHRIFCMCGLHALSSPLCFAVAIAVASLLVFPGANEQPVSRPMAKLLYYSDTQQSFGIKDWP
jgi:hypothetical protein